MSESVEIPRYSLSKQEEALIALNQCCRELEAERDAALADAAWHKARVAELEEALRLVEKRRRVKGRRLEDEGYWYCVDCGQRPSRPHIHDCPFALLAKQDAPGDKP